MFFYLECVIGVKIENRLMEYNRLFRKIFIYM